MRLPRPLVVLASLAAVAATLGVAEPASAADSWSVPGKASITIRVIKTNKKGVMWIKVN